MGKKKPPVKEQDLNRDQKRRMSERNDNLPRNAETISPKPKKAHWFAGHSRGELIDVLRNRRTNKTSRIKAETRPIFSSEPLIAYKYDPALGRNEEIMVTIKTTLQLEKNDRQAEHMRRTSGEVFGREIARPYVFGLLAAFPLTHDRLDWSLSESKWAFSVVEPYGVHACGNKIALATAKSVELIDMDTGEVKSCQNTWLNQGHTVEFSPDGKKLLVGSSGFDAVFEFDTESLEVVWQWFAWDHGFDQSKLGHYVVRSETKWKALKAIGHDVILVNDPKQYEFGIATRQKPAHLNSACYDSEEKILVTLFHQGAGYAIDRKSGDATEIISGLINPHKLSRRKCGGYFISDTRRGRLIFIDQNYRPTNEILLAGTPGVERPPHLLEYLQNSTELRDNLFACIDIHRSSLWLIDVKRRRYRGIKFPVEWSVHDVASLGREHRSRIAGSLRTRFGKVAAFSRRLRTIHHFAVDGREITAFALNPDIKIRSTPSFDA